MIINKNSWHYRLLDFFGFDHPHSLCPYFWKTVGCIAITFCAVFAVTAMSWAVFYLGGLVNLYPKLPSGMNPISFTLSMTFEQHVEVILYSLKIDAMIIAGIFAILYTLIGDGRRRWIHGLIYDSVLFSKIRKHDDYDEYRYEKRVDKRKTKFERQRERRENPGLIRAYFRARKHKFCPMLEFK